MNFFRGRSDLAEEIAEIYSVDENYGIEKEETSDNGIEVTKIKITTDKAAEIMGKEKGIYVTVNIRNAFTDDDVFFNASETLSREISSLIKGKIGKNDFSSIIIGLGNNELTSDSVGPDTVKGIIVTKHIRENMPKLYSMMNFNTVCALSPGVLGQTGIESAVTVKAVTEKINPDIVILIDALASHYPDKLCCTVQLSDNGISPGSGVGNCREALSSESLGVPVFTIGVPTVVDTVTLTGNIMDIILENLKASTVEQEITAYDRLSSAWNEDTLEMFKDKISDSVLNFIVTPKDIDCLVKKVSRLISISLNKALHNGISEEDINSLLG